jgi:hypothetical protein
MLCIYCDGVMCIFGDGDGGVYLVMAMCIFSHGMVCIFGDGGMAISSRGVMCIYSHGDVYIWWLADGCILCCGLYLATQNCGAKSSCCGVSCRAWARVGG